MTKREKGIADGKCVHYDWKGLWEKVKANLKKLLKKNEQPNKS